MPGHVGMIFSSLRSHENQFFHITSNLQIMKKGMIFSVLTLTAWVAYAQTWQARVAGFSYPVNGGQVYAINDHVAWAYGVEWDGDGQTYENTGLSRTVMAGNGWESVSFPTQEPALIINIAALDEFRAWILLAIDPEAEQPDFRLYKTIDGGITWDSQTIFLPTFPSHIHMWDENTGVVLSDPDPDGFRIRRTENGGETWAPVDNLPAALFDEVMSFNTTVVRSDEIWSATVLGRVLYSADRGLTWSVIESPFHDFLPVSIDVSERGQLYMVYYDHFAEHGDTRIYRKQLPNGPWLNLSEQVTTYYPYTIKAIPGSDVVAFTTYDWIDQHWLTRISTNEALSWVTLDSITHATYIDFYNAETGYASQENFSGGTTRIYRYVGSPLVGLFSQLPLPHASLSMTPNPGSSSSVINFKSAVGNDYRILVHTMQGQLMYSADHHASSNITHRMNMEGWPAGMYTVTITSKEGMISGTLSKQ
jgi:hypothetical protein